jgi:signal recognition particle receptor subunit beta
MPVKLKDYLKDNRQKIKAFFIVTGTYQAGKSSFLRTVVENKLIEIDESDYFTEPGRGFLGQIAISENAIILFWENPGARRYDAIMQDLNGLPFGVFLIVDSRKSETFREVRSIHETFKSYNVLHYLFLANFPKAEAAWTVDELKMGLRHDTIISCDALSLSDTRQALIRLLKSFDEESIKRLAEHFLDSIPVELLEDEQVLALADLQMSQEQGEKLNSLLEKQREGELDATGKKDLENLMAIYNHLLLRKGEAIAIAVERGLRPPYSED